MESPVTKLAAVTVVIIAISLSLIPFNNSISSSAYAFEQTIEANNSIHNLHILMSRSKGNKYLSVEIWAMCDNNGKATNLRAEISDDISEDDNQLRYFTWNDGILEIWWPSRNALYVCRTNENEIERYWQQLVNEYNPRVLYQYLYDESKLNESIELNINDLSRDQDFIKVQFKNHDNDTIKELVVDSKTKLVKQYTERDFSDDANTFDMKIEYLSYNQPLDESIFKLSQIPDNVMVYDRTAQLLGLEQGTLTDNEIAKVLVRVYLEAAIAKDYKEVSRLMESKLGDTFEELIVSGDIVEKFFRNNFNADIEKIISIGEPKSYMSRPDALYVPCRVEIKDENGSRRIVDIQVTAKSIKYESGYRWIINSIMKMGLILSGESVGDYQIGMSKDDVLKRLGKPRSLFYGEEKYTFKNLPNEYYISYNEISFRIKDGLVEEITALGPSYKFPNGLSVGDTEESVIQTFGNDFRVREFESKDFLYFDKEGLMFEIDKKNRIVSEINVTGNPQSSNIEHTPKDYPLKGIIIPCEGVGKIKLGMNHDDVIQRLGKPDVISSYSSSKHFTLENLPKEYNFEYTGNVSFCFIDGSIEEICIVENPYFKFDNGLGVGSSLPEIIEAFGDDHVLDDSISEYRDFLIYRKIGIVFEIKKDDQTVSEITVKIPW